MNSFKKTIVFALTGVLAASLLSGCGEEKLDGTKTVATVNGEEIPLGIVSLYARQQQAMYENFYQAYMGTTPGWDNVVDEETNQTYGEQMVQSSLETIEQMILMKENAADYGVEISEEDSENIKAAAEEFMAANPEETIEELGITQEQVETYLELQTIQTRMYDAVRAAAEVEITDEEATQSSFSYVSITVETEAEAEEVVVEDAEEAEETEEVEEAAEEETEEVEEAAEEETEEVEEAAEKETEEVEEAAEEETEEVEEAAEEETEEAAEDTEEADETAESEEDADAVDETEEASEEVTAEQTMANAQEILDQMLEDPTADMDEVAKAVDETYAGLTGTYTRSADVEDTSSSYPDEVLSVLRDLEDGEVYEELVQVDDTVYILRKDLDVDEEATETQRENLDDTARSEYYSDLLQEWTDNAEITTEDKVLATLVITDSHSFTYAETEEEEEAVEEETTEEVDETEETTEDAEAADETAETTEEAAEAAEDAETADEKEAEETEEVEEAAEEDAADAE